MSTHIDKLTKKLSEIQELVILYTGLEGCQYGNFFTEIGLCWAENFLQGNKQEASYLTSQPEFWGFWRLEWCRVQEQFLELVKYDVTQRRYCYHSVDQDTGDVYRVWGEEGIRLAYIFYMNDKMAQCNGNQVIMEMAFHKKVVKNGK